DVARLAQVEIGPTGPCDRGPRTRHDPGARRPDRQLRPEPPERTETVGPLEPGRQDPPPAARRQLDVARRAHTAIQRAHPPARGPAPLPGPPGGAPRRGGARGRPP